MSVLIPCKRCCNRKFDSYLNPVEAGSNWEEGLRICPESMPNPKSLAIFATPTFRFNLASSVVIMAAQQAAGIVCASYLHCADAACVADFILHLWSWVREVSGFVSCLPACVPKSFDKITTTAAVSAVIVVVVEGYAMRWPTAWYWWVSSAYSTTDHLRWNKCWNDDDVLGMSLFLSMNGGVLQRKVSR